MFVVNGRTGVVLAVCALWVAVARAEILTPPYFNLAEGRKITASATCGVDTEGPELYCKLVGANADNDVNVNLIQGQFCDYCDPNNPEKMHPPEFAVDGMETWWQSPPLSRGMKYNEVNLTIDLGQEFHVAYVYIRMGNSPRPGLWILEKSADYGQTWTPWQYFSDSPDDCETYFGKESLEPITKDDSVICTTEYSKIVPLEGGEIPISLLNNRPSANHYFNSSVLQEWTRATNIRFRFLRTKNLLGHLMSVARQDPTVTRRYFYSIKDISIGGRCMCNGHADTCDIQDPSNPSVLLCRCHHNTCGDKCQNCCPGFEQKAWRQSKPYRPFICEPCNCFEHSNECVYDPEVDAKKLSLDIYGKYEGGGVCQNCQHNTEGINCNRCKPTFYRPYNKHWNETDVCQPCRCDYFYSTGNCAEGSGMCECKKEYTPPLCDSCSYGYFGYPECKPCECNLNGTANLQCEAIDGQCYCLPNFGGKFCKECADGYYNFPECNPCMCNEVGSVSNSCHQETGNCQCKNNFGGKQCDQCQDGYYNYPACSYCNCDIKGTKEGVCDKDTGKCLCKEGYGGERCDMCTPEYFGYPDCQPCNCSLIGSANKVCDVTGKCRCLVNFAGRTCDSCKSGYYNYPECLSCNCDTHGSVGTSCDLEGVCQCQYNFDGTKCEKCKEGYYNFPSCEDCNCHPAGVVAGFAGCGSVPAGELCQCKERVQGRICDQCKPLYWNLHPNNAEGCEECNCHIPGVLSGIGVCDTDSGQCVCKPSVIARGCTECADGTYNLEENNLFGCTDCGCDIGGSLGRICDKKSGQCFCQSRVTGRTCKEPLQAHYFPTLYQYQYEVENGHTPANTAVRYAYDEEVFPEYSWKGYAVFSQLQNEILQDLYINKPSLYLMVLRYVNKNPETVVGTIKTIPENPNDIGQKLQVQFKNSSKPAFVIVSGLTGSVNLPLVMNPGRWTISIQVDKNLLLDYFVLLPEDFYLASILNQKVETPCTINEKGLCRDYSYPNVSGFDTSLGAGGFVKSGNNIRYLEEFFKDEKHLQQLNVEKRVPLLNSNQPEITYNITVSKPGRYVLLVDYITPGDDRQTYTIVSEVNTKNSATAGKLVLYSCPYTTICRQVITDKQSGVAIYPIDENELSVTLKGNNANVGIHSIVAIPLKEWSLDYIKPKPVCIRKDGKCLQSSYPNPPESKKIQFEQEAEVLQQPVTVVKVSNVTSYVQLNSETDTIDLHAKVPQPGYYTFVVQYYQPDFPEYNLDVLVQNGQFYEAKLPVPHCPSKSGCRSVVLQEENNQKFSLTENFMITIKDPSKKGVYLDYLLVVPTDLYTDRFLDEENLDRSSEFITTCASNHFNIDTSTEGFCKDSVFSITAGHNNGALPCQCDSDGSLSYECDKFGGQCQCKPNIIGRQCEACKTGYYGFPECKPCNCPSTAYCEPTTGQCICPPHVTGERCDQCMPYTYGFDPIIGCEECLCSPLGIENSFQCDLFNGSCGCKPNIVGRKCDVCAPGYYAFPHCASCECDLRGTTEEICDQVSAECFCKKNARGLTCDLCVEGTFNLQASNEEGCTECFCFGKTTRCSSSKLIRVPILHMNDWTVVAINESNKFEKADLNLTAQKAEEFAIGVDLTSGSARNKSVYLSAPSNYLGKRLASYGGYINYTIFYTIGSQGKAVSGADVILEGADMLLLHRDFEQPPAVSEYAKSLQLVEFNFELSSGLPAKREHIMTVLHDLRGIYIRVTYWSASITTRLSNVLMDDAVTYQGYRTGYRNFDYALTVEQCQCPPNYQGLSCEECAPGYYRIQSGPHGGFCVPCQCNGHADECDVNTGVCLNCQHHTRGEHCEMCDVGYHGNALQGTPMDCLICACPLPIPSNNFAKGCDVSADGEKISCDCNEGYFGARCQSCSAGYYGRPDIAGDFCKPCQCSGNINATDPSSCDTTTGRCLRCLNHTFGEACALCEPGYFGDAITLKDCQACFCDELGTERCDSHTGECQCRKNVVGEKCDRCALEHYGFPSGQGCAPCDCAVASESAQCNDVTGQCRCKPGVTGRACDRCAAGYWNYTADGCISCGCKSEYSLGFGCNPYTGQCECLPGVVGEKCDQCPHRWVFVPEFGCHECDSCTHALLDTTDSLSLLIDPVIDEFDNTKSGYFTNRRLAHLNDTLHDLMPKVSLITPDQVNFSPVIQELESLEQDSKNMNRKTNYSLENSDMLMKEADDLHEKAISALDEIIDASDVVQETIDDINQLATHLTEGEGPKIDLAVQEAQQILDGIKIYNLTGRASDANEELEKVNRLLNNLHDFKRPVNKVDGELGDLKGLLKQFNDKLDDLYNHTQYSLNKAVEAGKLHERNGKERVQKKLQNIKNQTTESEQNLKQSAELLKNASILIDGAKLAFKDIEDLPNNLEVTNSNFDVVLDNNDKQIADIANLQPTVQEHAANLSRRAQELDNLLSETRDTSLDAVKAANAYKNIVDAIDKAEIAADDGKNAVDNAVDLLSKVKDKTSETDSDSQVLYNRAIEAENTARNKLNPVLEEAKDKYLPVERQHNKNKEMLDNIEKLLKQQPTKSLDDILIEAKRIAENADKFAISSLSATEGFTNLSEERQTASQLPKDLDDAKRNIDQARRQLDNVNENLPKIVSSLKDLPERQTRIQRAADRIQSNINKLNQQIALARDIANRIKVGVKFYPNTTLELRNPPNLNDLSTSTHISGYFKTPKEDGLLLYLGNGNGTNLPRTKSDDYMALVIQGGYPVLNFDVGNGREQIILDKYVAKDTWYQFIIDKTGHNVKLSIREELEGGKENITTKEYSLNGQYSMFNLDQNRSKIFVGGYPLDFKMQEEIPFNSFEGEVEDLVIGDTPVSLWNFNQGYENNHGAYERDSLVNLQPSTGYRFNGHGYAVLPARSYSLRTRSDVKLSFKTFATEGLLFLAGKKTFIALELRNGKILYQYNLGAETKLWHTPKTYNDGNWHTIRASRDGSKGQFIVDDEVIPDRTNKVIGGHSLDHVDTVFFGGYPAQHSIKEVTNTDLDGCIDNVTIMGNPVDLSQNLKAYDVTAGCPAKFERLISFANKEHSYIKRDNISVNNDFKVSLKFKTKANEGLIFYATDRDQIAGISLALNNGHLILISQKTELKSKHTFNDSEWHVVTVSHNEAELRVDFDDYGYKVTDTAPPQLHILYGDIYIGGLPEKFRIKKNKVGSTHSFVGCIGDATFKGSVINFANSTDKNGVILGKCILDKTFVEEAPDVHPVPTLPPLDELFPFTTVGPEYGSNKSRTDDSPKRGDGGFDVDREDELTTISPAVKPGQVPTTTPKPHTEGCALPMEPVIEEDVITSRSFRFGFGENSRLEYPTSRGKYKNNYDFSLEFKTTEDEGVLLYVSSPDEKQRFYVGLFMRNGHLHYKYSGGGEPAEIISEDVYNDGTWHLVEISRNGPNGKLVVDGNPYPGRTLDDIETVRFSPPYYLGGVRENMHEVVFENLKVFKYFVGCIRNFNMNNKPMEKPNSYGVIPCSDNVETGTFFSVGGGFVKLRDKFKVGTELDIKLDIKPRNDTGVLIAVHGRKDYLVLEMIKGVMKFTVENGRGAIHTSFQPNKPYYFCDGRWHNIQAVKSKSVVTLSVDSTFTSPGVGDPRETSTDTGGALFLGGHRFIHRARGLSVRTSFVGCIRNVYVNNHAVTLVPSMAEGNVTVGSCPTN